MFRHDGGFWSRVLFTKCWRSCIPRALTRQIVHNARPMPYALVAQNRSSLTTRLWVENQPLPAVGPSILQQRRGSTQVPKVNGVGNYLDTLSPSIHPPPSIKQPPNMPQPGAPSTHDGSIPIRTRPDPTINNPSITIYAHALGGSTTAWVSRAQNAS